MQVSCVQPVPCSYKEMQKQSVTAEAKLTRAALAAFGHWGFPGCPGLWCRCSTLPQGWLLTRVLLLPTAESHNSERLWWPPQKFRWWQASSSPKQNHPWSKLAVFNTCPTLSPIWLPSTAGITLKEGCSTIKERSWVPAHSPMIRVDQPADPGRQHPALQSLCQHFWKPECMNAAN